MPIAVVIPALDEAESIRVVVESARDAAACDGPVVRTPGRSAGDMADDPPVVEVIVVDGGSRDRTADRARAAGARVIKSPPGRARQLDAGWRATEAEVVLFLHADTRLPRGFATAVERALRDPSVAGGAFRLSFDESSWGLRIVEWGAHLRAARLGLPYGDQALFARRTVLEAAGGVRQVPLLEDLDLARAIAARGRLVLLPESVVTSARRYRNDGTFRTWARNALALLGWRLGVDRGRLAEWYRR